MVMVARSMGVVRITIQRVWGYEGIVLYLSFEGSYTNPSIIELHRTVHQKKKSYHMIIFKNKITSSI